MVKLKIVVILIFFSSILISLAVPNGSCLDVSCRAIKARESNEYSPNTAWELGYTGKGVVIAMIDTGIDDEHESLEGKFVAGVDVRKPWTPQDGSYNPNDTASHGTYTAGIGVGRGNAIGMYNGVAPDAKYVDVCMGSIHPQKSLIDSVEWCISHYDTEWEGQTPEYYGIDIIWLMTGWSDPDAELNLKVNEAVEKGIVVVQCIGNSGPNNTEDGVVSAADKVIGVGAVDDKDTINRSDDEVCDFSSRGPRTDDGDDDSYDELQPTVAAYGTGIISAKYGTEDEYWDLGYGTCFANAHVAGVVALMLEANANLTPEQVKEILQETAEPRGTPEHPEYPFPHNKWNRSYGYGIVDAYAAVKRALELRPPEPNILPSISITSPENNAKVSGSITISGTAVDTDGNVINVELKIDEDNWFNVSIVSASSLEWNYSWDTKNVENGMHTIYARAYDGMNHSTIISVDVNVYNKLSAGVEEKIKINPIYLISGAGIIGLVVIIVVCVLLFRRKKMLVKPAFPVGTGIPPPPATGVSSVTAQCPQCGNIIEITSKKRPLKVQCPKCGAKSLLR